MHIDLPRNPSDARHRHHPATVLDGEDMRMEPNDYHLDGGRQLRFED